MKKHQYILIIFFIMVFILPCDAQFTKLVVSLTGNILDAINKQPITVELQALDKTGKIVYRGKSNKGYYFITGLKPGETYTMKFGDFNYFNQTHDVEIPKTDKYSEFSHDFLVKPRQKGLKVLIPVPPFELNKTKIRYGIDILLEDVVSMLKENPKVKFEIACYPDNDFDIVINKTLTRERCENFKDYLVNSGINEERISLRPEIAIDKDNPPPTQKTAKGKRYIGSTYIIVQDF